MRLKITKTPTVLLGSILLLLLAGSFAGPAATNEMSAAAEVLRTTLTNGLQVIIVRNTLAPVVTTMVNYRVGSTTVRLDFRGQRTLPST